MMKKYTDAFGMTIEKCDVPDRRKDDVCRQCYQSSRDNCPDYILDQIEDVLAENPKAIINISKRWKANDDNWHN